MNCLVVINQMSGNAAKIDEKRILSKYAAEDDVSVKYLRAPEDAYSLGGVEKLIVCGGDGTLHNALTLCRDRAIDLYYLPCGTFNETAKATAGKGIRPMEDAGRIGDMSFAYVAAAGSFTDLGQAAASGAKKRFKLFAYFAKVLSAYRVHRIRARIQTEKVKAEGVYTLLMISNAKRCFGFRFNRLHKKDKDALQLIAVKAPRRDDLWGRIKMFFPFFRVFFLGFSKEHLGKTVLVTSFYEAKITLFDKTPFCLDGESALLFGENVAKRSKGKARLFLIKE